jgi:hypothetical protein
VRVLIFIMITVVEMDMWRPFVTGRRKLRRLRLTVLHKVQWLLEDFNVLFIYRLLFCLTVQGLSVLLIIR